MSAWGGEAVFTISPQPIYIQTQIRLPDVSYYQDEINFLVMKPLVDGVIIRAGQRFWEDIRFKINWLKAKAAGIPRGSYWLYDSREDPKKQAALWWSLIQGDPGELVHVADLEEAYGGPYGKPADMQTFIQEFQRLSGLPDARVAIYTGYFWWTSRVGNNPFFKRFQLWLAWYAAMAVVRVPVPWTEADLIFWQYTSSGDGHLYGVSSLEIDLNWYCCDAASFSKRFGLGASTPPTGGEMTQIIEGTAKSPVLLRTGPGTEYATGSWNNRNYLAMNSTIEAVYPETAGKWLQLKNINGVDVIGTLWASAGSTQQYISWRVVTVPDEPLPNPDPVPPVLPDILYIATQEDMSDKQKFQKVL